MSKHNNNNSNKPQHLNRSKRKEEFLQTSVFQIINEDEGLSTRHLESDSLAAAYDTLSKTYRPSISCR